MNYIEGSLKIEKLNSFFLLLEIIILKIKNIISVISKIIKISFSANKSNKEG